MGKRLNLPQVVKGERLGIIVHVQPATTKFCFGDSDWKSVFFATRASLGTFRVKNIRHTGRVDLIQLVSSSSGGSSSLGEQRSPRLKSGARRLYF